MVRKKQKDIELFYLEDARKASNVFPAGRPIANEPLDFLFDGSDVGVEITELCVREERQEGARLGYVAPNAKRIYEQLGGGAVSVSPVLSIKAEQMDVKKLAQGLADFVFRHRDANENFRWDRCPDLPEGYVQIGVFPSQDPGGQWRYFRSIETLPLTRELVASRIAEKDARVVEYRKVAKEVWLLLINDLFLGPGEVFTSEEEVALWTFKSSFDRLLLFQRQAGGTGTVIELRQQ